MINPNESILVYPVGFEPLGFEVNEENTYLVGIPIDMQMDDFFVSEWQVDGPDVNVNEKPAWIQFVNHTISESGIQFRLTPSLEQV